jgi:FlaA1/EpsC-like NDP-sugar epimerase
MPKRVLIVGAGTAGRSLADSIAAAGDIVVGFLDDSQTTGNVLGTLASVNEVIRANDIDELYFAIPTASAGRVREFLATLESPEVGIAIVPRTYDIISKDTVSIDDLTDVDVLDLVGREPVKHDLLAAHQFIEGKRVVITGAAGSIGSRLTRQVARMGASKIVCVDRWENGIFYLGESIGGDDRLSYRVADITDEAGMASLLAQEKPDVLFHAAAYKHVPLMQENPLAAIVNNVWGTLNILEAAMAHHVANVVYVSTDKAVNPVNVMGATKRIGEMMMEALAPTAPGTVFTAVRFGNVIESNGSVMQTFRKQIASGGPVTVTHEDVTRFFMTIDEASQLIIQSASLGADREIFVLDMGEPVRIMDLARGLVRATRPGTEIVVTGLRPGEKLFEELSYEPDRVQRTSNNKIFIVKDEQPFDAAPFLAATRELISDARRAQISPTAAVERLRAFGFAIQ